MTTSPMKSDVALKYLDSINDDDYDLTPSKRPLQPTGKHNSKVSIKRSHPEEDLDKLAMQLEVNPISTPTKTALLRTKFETPSVTVSSFKTPSNISSGSSSRSGSPIKRNLRNFETPIKRPTELPSLKNDFSKQSDTHNKPYLSSPSNSTSIDSPGYEYLCRIMAIKIWLENVIEEEIEKSPAELISDIRNGILLAKLSNVILPTKRSVFTNPKLQFRHTENINRFFKLLDFMSVPDLFTFELTDLYDAKNIPKVWFCLHAMSYMLHKSDPSYPLIESLVGKCDFTPEDIRTANRSLVGTGLPNFASADNDDSTFESSFMNKAISNSPKKNSSPNKIERKPVENKSKSSSRSDPFRDDNTPDKLNQSSNSDGFYTPKSQIIQRPSHLDNTNYKESKYYTPELDHHLTNIVKLQALSRGAGFRYRMFVNKIILRSYSDEFIHFNSIIRGNMSRMRSVHRHRDELMLFKHDIMDLQAIVRGKVLRSSQTYDFKPFTSSITKFQSIIRGKLQKGRIQLIKFTLLGCQKSISELQAQLKMLLVYKKTMVVMEHKDDIEPSMIEFQSIARNLLFQRNKISNVISNLENGGGLTQLQAFIRGKNSRKEFFTKQYVLHKSRKRITQLQGVARGGIIRTKLCNSVLITLINEDLAMNELFAKARGNLVRREVSNKRYFLQKYEANVVNVQSLFRGLYCRFEREIKLEDCYSHIHSIISLQSVIRGKALRNELNSIDSYYYKNMNRLIKAQAVCKRNFAQRAYQSLITMKNPPLSIIRRFAYLLSDNDTDFEQELELAELKDKIIEKSKANEELETLIENLDIKLGLLDKNKISIEDFIKNKFNQSDKPKNETKNLEKLNKSSRERIESYQSLFYFLQTKPIYLVRLHENIDSTLRQSIEFRNLQKYILLLFPIKDSSITYHSREEFFLVKFISSLMENDVQTKCENITDITKSNVCFWIDYLLNFNNPTYQRLHLKGMLGKTVSSVIDNDELDFEPDPSIINSSFVDRDMRIDGFSDRDAKAPAQVAIKDPDVSAKFVENLMNLREFASETLNTIEMNIDRVPLHIRMICAKAYDLSKLTFPDRSELQHLSVSGVIFVKHYLSNILQYPENFGLLMNDQFNSAIYTAKVKNNLKHLNKVMMQIFSLRSFSDNFLKPLNEYIGNSIDIAKSLIIRLINVGGLESEYKLNDYDDIVTHDRPKLTMKVSDMVQIEKIIQRNIDTIAPSSDDQLFNVAHQLNSAVNSADDLVALSELGALTLNLNPTTKEESIADTKGNALFTQVKRSVLYIIRVQEGTELLDLLVAGIKPQHEELFKEITHTERQELEDINVNKKKKAYHKTSLGDLTTISYHELKKNALETILQLEFMGLVSRQNSYQEILNQIAVDIKTKHQQRVSRKSQLDIAIRTDRKLIEKEHFLKKQHIDYNTHIDNILSELQLKPKDKKLFNILPIFSKQYFYHRELKKSNRLPKFGSYKYSAKKLMEQKVLIDFGGALNARYGSSSKLDFMFSCHQAGKFTIEAASGSVNLPGAFSSITLDELLNLQYENADTYEAFDGMVIFNSANLTSFIFKKFYDLKKE